VWAAGCGWCDSGRHLMAARTWSRSTRSGWPTGSRCGAGRLRGPRPALPAGPGAQWRVVLDDGRGGGPGAGLVAEDRVPRPILVRASRCAAPTWTRRPRRGWSASGPASDGLKASTVDGEPIPSRAEAGFRLRHATARPRGLAPAGAMVTGRPRRAAIRGTLYDTGMGYPALELGGEDSVRAGCCDPLPGRTLSLWTSTRPDYRRIPRRAAGRPGVLTLRVDRADQGMAVLPAGWRARLTFARSTKATAHGQTSRGWRWSTMFNQPRSGRHRGACRAATVIAPIGPRNRPAAAATTHVSRPLPIPTRRGQRYIQFVVTTQPHTCTSTPRRIALVGAPTQLTWTANPGPSLVTLAPNQQAAMTCTGRPSGRRRPGTQCEPSPPRDLDPAGRDPAATVAWTDGPVCQHGRMDASAYYKL